MTRARADEGAMWVPPSHQPTPMAPVTATLGWHSFTPRMTDEDVDRVASRVVEKLRRR